MKKRILGLFLVIVVLATCSCNSNNEVEDFEKEEDDNSIELTLDNYGDYLDIEYTCNECNSGDIRYTVDVTGASTNFNYNDVELTVKIEGGYSLYDNREQIIQRGVPHECELTVSTNIAGNGSATNTVEYFDPVMEQQYLEVGKTEFEVISVSGSVTPAYTRE